MRKESGGGCFIGMSRIVATTLEFLGTLISFSRYYYGGIVYYFFLGGFSYIQ